jgi:membrane protease YdiL (CAAX protease family)
LFYDVSTMQLHSVFINPATQRLRSGWRVLIYVTVLALPNLIIGLLLKATSPSSSSAASSTFDVSWSMIAVYAVTNVWVIFVSIVAFRWLDGASWRAWGYLLHQGWSRDLFIGLFAGLLMIASVVGMQMLGGGTRLHAAAQGFSWRGIVAATVLLWLAAAFEELLFRGYAFQTLLRDVPAWVPVLILNLFFGLAHWTNPSRTAFSTINTALAGVWLAVAVMRTRSLWLATGLHFSWNWTMGVLFGLPVSGMRLPNTFLFASSVEPLWLTGGSYGSEGGVTATLAFTLAALWIWRTAKLRVAPQTELALSDQSQL